jgi:glycosyltransferase involved in cell wall biosynthesis
VGNARAWLRTPATDRLDGVARFIARRASLQRLDAAARLAALVSPRLRDYRLARSLAVSGNLAGRDSLAHAASGGRISPADLMVALDAYQDAERWSESTTVLRHVRPRQAELLAWVMFNQNRNPSDAPRALALLEWLRERGGADALSGMGRQAYLELLRASEQFARLREQLPPLETASGPDLRLWTDATNPHLADNEDQASGTWLAHFNRPYVAAGLAPVAIDQDADGSPFDQLTTSAVDTVDEQPLVTVVVSSFKPDRGLLTAVRSIAASSWSNLEILVCDDASGHGYEDWYAQAAALDSRVSVRRMRSNGGTYRIRNVALDEARGDLITFHDSDDWMHPQRIETQVRHLLANPALPANTSSSTRVTADLSLVNGRSLGPKICEPSLLMRRTTVVDKVGYFDHLRKAADAEFRLRIETGFGVRVPTVGVTPLTLQLITADSLSDTDIRRYWIHLDRRVHRACYEQWHREQSANGGTPYVPREDVPENRAFYAPASIGGIPANAHYDVVIAGNWLNGARFGRIERRQLDLALTLATQGSCVAIAHLDQLWAGQAMRLSLSARVISLLNSGTLGYVGTQEAVTADVLALTDDAATIAESGATAHINAAKTVTLSNVSGMKHGDARTQADAVAALLKGAHVGGGA